jgi:hypothetical protein
VEADYNTSPVVLRDVEGDGKNPVVYEHNWATLSLGDRGDLILQVGVLDARLKTFLFKKFLLRNPKK